SGAPGLPIARRLSRAVPGWISRSAACSTGLVNPRLSLITCFPTSPGAGTGIWSSFRRIDEESAMFVHTEHLPQILSTQDYTSQAQFDRERDRLFLPAWHLVGTFTDIPGDGDFRTFHLHGQELITWKSG